MAKKGLQLDEIGYWSEIKLEIIRKYASAYSKILARQSFIKKHLYIDAFAGAGTHISKETREMVPGSPLNAVQVEPPFSELHLIDVDGSRAQELQRLTTGDQRVHVYEGDCNDILLRDVFPRCKWEDYRRALCVLDPYKLNVDWRVLAAAGSAKTIEVFYNFMIMDANMNVFLRDPGKVTAAQAARMEAVWGDASWRDLVYRKTPTLFGDRDEKLSNDEIAEAFRERLEKIAGFAYVPKPIPMRNLNGAVIYYLYFATPKAVAADIVDDVFAKYRDRGAH